MDTRVLPPSLVPNHAPPDAPLPRMPPAAHTGPSPPPTVSPLTRMNAELALGTKPGEPPRSACSSLTSISAGLPDRPCGSPSVRSTRMDTGDSARSGGSVVGVMSGGSGGSGGTSPAPSSPPSPSPSSPSPPVASSASTTGIRLLCLGSDEPAFDALGAPDRRMTLIRVDTLPAASGPAPAPRLAPTHGSVIIPRLFRPSPSYFHALALSSSVIVSWVPIG